MDHRDKLNEEMKAIYKRFPEFPDHEGIEGGAIEILLQEAADEDLIENMDQQEHEDSLSYTGGLFLAASVLGSPEEQKTLVQQLMLMDKDIMAKISTKYKNIAQEVSDLVFDEKYAIDGKLKDIKKKIKGE